MYIGALEIGMKNLELMIYFFYLYILIFEMNEEIYR